MSKADNLLDAFKDNLGEWTCAYCKSGSNQPAAIFREVKKLGYAFEEPSPNRWGKEMFCKNCQDNRTHYKLLKDEPQFSTKNRVYVSAKTRTRILKIFDSRDAFTGATISSVAEIDHKVPWSRLAIDLDPNEMPAPEIKNHFQLLTREHNLLKDRMCGRCIQTNKRPPFFEIAFWYKGDENYTGSCVGCGWYDGIKWREEVTKKLSLKK